MNRHPITKADAETQAAALIECERFRRDIGIEPPAKYFNDDGTPKYVACFDNGGKTYDRYTVVFTRSSRRNRGQTIYLGMSAEPFHPQGFGQHGHCEPQRYGWKGDRRMSWADLPADCQRAALQTYRDIWAD